MREYFRTKENRYQSRKKKLGKNIDKQKNY